MLVMRHVGKGSQDDFNDAKIWLEPEIEVARPGRTLKRHALGQAPKVIFDTFALGKWTIIACLTHVACVSKPFFENYEGKSKFLFTKLCDTL